MSAARPLRSDCARCAALCCMAYAAESVAGFAASKNAAEPCPNLSPAPGGGCTIYARRAEDGFAGCLRFECFGAGQYVTQALFGGRDWRAEPALRLAMAEAFPAALKAHELLWLADRAEGDARLGPRGEAELAAVTAALEAALANRGGLRDAALLPALERRLRRLYAALA